jgi:hypothetical protein
MSMKTETDLNDRLRRWRCAPPPRLNRFNVFRDEHGYPGESTEDSIRREVLAGSRSKTERDFLLALTTSLLQ